MSARIQSTVYPIEYNKHNPLEGFNEWAAYIHAEVMKMGHNGQPVLRHYNSKLAKKVCRMNRLANEAKEILNK